MSGVIEEESKLLVATEQLFRAVFNVDARTSCEAIAIDPKKKTVDLRDVKTGKVTTEPYDKLVLSPGAAPIRPPLPGIDLPGIFSVRTLPDARTIRQWLHRGEEDRTGMDSYAGHQVVTKPKRAVVVGGGFIGRTRTSARSGSAGLVGFRGPSFSRANRPPERGSSHARTNR